MDKRSLIGTLAVFLLSCQSGKQSPAASSSPVSSPHQATSGMVKAAYQDSDTRDPVRDKALAIQSIKASLQQKMVEKPELREVIQKMLTQPEKFNALAETCSVTTDSPKKICRTKIGFTNFFKVSGERYILHLQCYTGAYQPGGVYFLFTQVGGIQTKPLVLTKLIGYEAGDIQEIPNTGVDSQSIAGYKRFDDEKKELYLTYRCDGPWSCYAMSKYFLVDNQLVLQEYIVGFRNIASKDIRYTTYQLIRDQHGWVSSGAMKCKEVGLETCTGVINQ